MESFLFQNHAAKRLLKVLFSLLDIVYQPWNRFILLVGIYKNRHYKKGIDCVGSIVWSNRKMFELYLPILVH